MGNSMRASESNPNNYLRASARNYYTVSGSAKRKDTNCCTLFFRDFPYSLFKQRRKDPDTKQYVLAGKYSNLSVTGMCATLGQK